MGLSNRAIAQAIGRNDSMISQIARGARGPGYGSNLRASLGALRAELSARQQAGVPARQAVREAAVAPPSRRVRATGAPARVRRPTTVRGPAFSTTTTRRQASRHGAHGMVHPLADAANKGHVAAVDVSVSRSVFVEGTSGGRAHKVQTGRGGKFEMHLGTAAEAQARLREYGGDFSAMVLGEALGRGLIRATGQLDASAVESIELRTWAPRV